MSLNNLPDLSSPMAKMKVIMDLEDWCVWAPDSLIKVSLIIALDRNNSIAADQIIRELGEQIKDNREFMAGVLGNELVQRIENLS